jgi:hypothetical protein
MSRAGHPPGYSANTPTMAWQRRPRIQNTRIERWYYDQPHPEKKQARRKCLDLVLLKNPFRRVRAWVVCGCLNVLIGDCMGGTAMRGMNLRTARAFAALLVGTGSGDLAWALSDATGRPRLSAPLRSARASPPTRSPVLRPMWCRPGAARLRPAVAGRRLQIGAARNMRYGRAARRPARSNCAAAWIASMRRRDRHGL